MPKPGFGLWTMELRGTGGNPAVVRICRENEMATNTQEGKALMWTGAIVAAIVVLALIAFYSGMIPTN